MNVSELQSSLPSLVQGHQIESSRGRVFAQSWTPEHERGAPIMLLHDSLGCVTLWRDFPARLMRATGRKVIAYDRLGFGRSDVHDGLLPASFVEDEARCDFELVRQHLAVDRFVALGHSVGGSMAVACAAAYPDACMGVVTMSAQAYVNDMTREGIRAAEHQFTQAGQMERLARYHGAKAQWVLRAWVDTWLSDAFRAWRLDAQLAAVRCPVLCLHGDRDEFGTASHPERIVSLVQGAAAMHLLPNCGHVPHREHPEKVLSIVTDFLSATGER